MKRAMCVFALLWTIAGARAAPAPPPAPVVLDRLFFSAEERHALERPRRPSSAPSSAPLPQPSGAPAAARPERPIGLDSAGVPRAAVPAVKSVEVPPPKMTGFVRRSSGNDTVWINQQPQYRRRD